MRLRVSHLERNTALPAATSDAGLNCGICWGLTFDMRGGRQPAKPDVARPLDGRVRFHSRRDLGLHQPRRRELAEYVTCRDWHAAELLTLTCCVLVEPVQTQPRFLKLRSCGHREVPTTQQLPPWQTLLSVVRLAQAHYQRRS